MTRPRTSLPRPRRRHRSAARISTAALIVAAVLPVGSPPRPTSIVVQRVVQAPVVVATGHPPPATMPAAEPAVAAAASPAPAAVVVTARWSWPVGPPHDLVRSFEAPASRYGPGHRGIDIVARPGDPVRAPADGVVSFSGVVVDRPVLSIQHDEALVSSVEPVVATVNAGERVSAGQVVGVVASGAHCSEMCLHFGVRRHGQYISPILFLGGLSRAVLLPLPPAGPVLHPAR
jgi:murein DD-endopeptidase MepM/ murein hydrolase activator NlpD